MICNRRSIAAAVGLLVLVLPGAATNASAQGTTVHAPAAPDLPGQPVVGTGQLRHDLTPWSMFTSADVVVQAVMVGLAIASVVTWTVWLAKGLELTLARRELRRSLAGIRGTRSLPDAATRVGSGRGIVHSFLDAAKIELHLSPDVVDKQGIKERIATRLARLEAAAARDMNRGTGLLATIGATEALLATAMGLFAAIPAVIIYNHFTRATAGYRALLGDASAETLRLVSRDLDKGYSRGMARAAE
jgi:biopolymer transport protein ExbB